MAASEAEAVAAIGLQMLPHLSLASRRGGVRQVRGLEAGSEVRGNLELSSFFFGWA